MYPHADPTYHLVYSKHLCISMCSMTLFSSVSVPWSGWASTHPASCAVSLQGPRDDDLYVMDVANALLETVTDSSLPTRVRASWALGNLCDALVLKQQTQDGYDIPISLITRLVDAALIVARDSDKVMSLPIYLLESIAACARVSLILTHPLTSSTCYALIRARPPPHSLSHTFTRTPAYRYAPMPCEPWVD